MTDHRRGTGPDQWEAEARVQTAHSDSVPLDDDRMSPDYRGAHSAEELRAIEESNMREKLDAAWIHVTRLKNYVPRYLYENLCKMVAEELGEKNGVPSYVKHFHGNEDQLRIFVTHVNPPIPIRRWDWCAHYDDEEGPQGEGSTPYMAILDLINNYNPTERVSAAKKV